MSASEPLAKFNFSFSPSFSLGSEARLTGETVSTVYLEIANFGAASETVKTVAEFQRAGCNPKLKLGENEKLNFASRSSACREVWWRGLRDLFEVLIDLLWRCARVIRLVLLK